MANADYMDDQLRIQNSVDNAVIAHAQAAVRTADQRCRCTGIRIFGKEIDFGQDSLNNRSIELLQLFLCALF